MLSSRHIRIATAAVALGIALQINDGLFDPIALALLVVTIGMLAAAIWLPAGRLSQRAAMNTLLAGVLVVIAAGFFRPAGGRYRLTPPGPQVIYYAGLAAAAAGVIAVRLRPRWAGLGAVYLLILFAGLGIWKIRDNPRPFIDVYDFQTDAPAALVQGVNPYSITFHNLYGPGAPVYGPGMVRGDRLMFGFPYPPLVLYWITPAARLLGDFRYAYVLALAVAGALICRMAPGPLGVMAASLLLFSPRIFYVIESGWTEPLSVMLLSLTVWLRLKESRWTLPAFGLFLASKQYLPIALLLAPLLVSATPPTGRWRRCLAVAAGAGVIAAAISAPLVLWGLPDFIHSAITLQLHQPFRDDALSLLVPINRLVGHGDALAASAFVAAAVVAWVCTITARDSQPTFVAAFTLQAIAFFALNKQAFANYYTLVIAGLCLVLVRLSSGPRDFEIRRGP